MTETTALSFQDVVQTTSSMRTAGVPFSLWGLWGYSAEYEILKILPWKPTLLATLLSTGMLVGTGGIASANLVPLSSESPTYLVWSTKHTPRRPSPFIDAGERLVALRRYFSLNITDLARVLKVERPTIYSWLQGNSAPHPGNLKRLENLYQLSRDWRTLSAVPVGKYVREPFEHGLSLLDYLSADDLDESAIRHAFRSIKPCLVQEQIKSTMHRRSVVEVAKLHGFAPVPEAIQKKNFDEETNL